MPYSTSNPPVLFAQSIGNVRLAQWSLSGTDATTDVDTTGYITNARALGMKAGDIVWYIKTDASPLAVWQHIVTAINANGSADLSNGTALTATNSD
jgi:hypothetical protein